MEKKHFTQVEYKNSALIVIKNILQQRYLPKIEEHHAFGKTAKGDFYIIDDTLRYDWNCVENETTHMVSIQITIAAGGKVLFSLSNKGTFTDVVEAIEQSYFCHDTAKRAKCAQKELQDYLDNFCWDEQDIEDLLETAKQLNICG